MKDTSKKINSGEIEVSEKFDVYITREYKRMHAKYKNWIKKDYGNKYFDEDDIYEIYHTVICKMLEKNKKQNFANNEAYLWISLRNETFLEVKRFLNKRERERIIDYTEDSMLTEEMFECYVYNWDEFLEDLEVFLEDEERGVYMYYIKTDSATLASTAKKFEIKQSICARIYRDASKKAADLFKVNFNKYATEEAKAIIKARESYLKRED